MDDDDVANSSIPAFDGFAEEPEEIKEPQPQEE